MFIANGLPSREADRNVQGQKRCPKCRIFTPINGYYKSNRRAGWLAEDGTYRQSYCKRCQAKDRSRQGRERVAFLAQIKIERGCSRCGYRECSESLDFHHIDKKNFSISKTACSGGSTKRLYEELSKCVILCANCHRRCHATGRSAN